MPVIFIGVLLGSNLLFRPYEPHFYFFDYLYEITHDYDGPVEAIVNYLRKHAKAGDTVKIIYGDAQVMFYLSHLRLINDYFYKEKNFPDFIVDRYYWRREEEARLKKQKGDLSEEETYLKEIEKRYEKIELDAIDIIWENRPDDLGYHKFRTVKEGRPVVVYRKNER